LRLVFLLLINVLWLRMLFVLPTLALALCHKLVELSIALCFRRHRNPKGAASIPSTAPSRPTLP
jgi:hypothetical protein